jgi:hypothetical protein
MAVPQIVIDRAGLKLPTYDELHLYFRSVYQDVYGGDIVITPDSQDGQLLAIMSLAVHDAYSAAAAVYNSFSPSTAQGVGLSRVVKINGIERHVPTYSTADLRIVGQPGTIIRGGIVSDVQEQRWLLPDIVTIPDSGELVVSATAEDIGEVRASPLEINNIVTPERGWQSVSNKDFAYPGAPVETDTHLRKRQAVSAAIPSITSIEGMVGAVAAVPGVTRAAWYENDYDVRDSIGLPPHSIAFVVEGGTALDVAQALFSKKTPGARFIGDTMIEIIDEFGIAQRVFFYRPIMVPITYHFELRRLPGYVVDVENKIRAAMIDWTNAVGIGKRVMHGRAYVPANLNGDPTSDTYEILSIGLARGGQATAPQDILIGIREVAYTQEDYITFRIVG